MRRKESGGPAARRQGGPGASRRDAIGARRRDAVLALALLALVVALAVAAVADGGGRSMSGSRGSDGNASLPPGWHEIGRPITGILYPKQLFAAATYPVVFHHEPRSCWPNEALRQMPPNGVLLQLIEYSRTDATGKPVRVPHLPPRPHRFSYGDATYAPFECAGPSYKFDYMQGGHALQAQVWMHRNTVDPKFKAAALKILSHFDPGSG